MTDRERAKEIARQILKAPHDLGWIIPLALEFLKLVEREEGKSK